MENPFKAGEVLLTDGIFKTSQDTGKSFVLSLDPDRLLAPTAYFAGAITDTSKFYGGWEAYNYRGYKGKGIAGHSLGHWLSAAADMYAVTGDEKIKAKLDYTVSKLAEYQRLDGSGYIGGFEKTGFEKTLSGEFDVSAFDLNGYWVPWYSLHKIYQGLIDAYRLADSETALDVVRGFADWAVNVTGGMSEEKFSKMLTCEYGGMNEAMAELYVITGDRKYFNLAVRFSQSAVIDPLSEGRDELQGKHANTQIPKILGAAAIYDIDKSKENYRRAAEFFYNTVVNRRSYCIGGNSDHEHFGSVTEETLSTQTCETCNTYNMMKLAEYLYNWEHKAEYMDYYEKALFNHILASQDPQSGMKTYFMATKQGHFKVYSTKEDSFWCCVGSGMENPARYTRNIYYKDGNDIYINQFISSLVNWSEKGLKLSQTTNYPYEENVVIKVEEGNADASVKIRIPAWIKGAAVVKVNDGEAVNVSKTGYYTIERHWNAGDTITVTFPMGLHIYTARDDNHKTAFMYGPTVLAGALGTENFPACDIVSDHTSLDLHGDIIVNDIVVSDKNPDTFIKPIDLSRLEFEMTSQGNKIKLIPYFDLHHQRYSLYWNVYGTDEKSEKTVYEPERVIIDIVRPNEQQPEVDHAMKKNNSYSGYSDTAARGWREARGSDGYFSYEMKVCGGDNCLAALYSGNDGEYEREFEILADNEVIGVQKLENNSQEKLFYAYYEIPRKLTENKEKITIKFRPTGEGKAAGRVFELKICRIKKEI